MDIMRANISWQIRISHKNHVIWSHDLKCSVSHMLLDSQPIVILVDFYSCEVLALGWVEHAFQSR